MLKKLSSTESKECCRYQSYRLQPLSVSNRHLHAEIADDTFDIRVSDVEFKKQFVFQDAVDRTKDLLSEKLLPHGLSHCNLIAYHWDLAVLQVFYKSGVHFVVCNCSTQTCIYKYEMCPCFKRRPGLCDAFFTSDKQFLVLKASEPYLLKLSPKRSCDLEKSFFEIVDLGEQDNTSNHCRITDFSSDIVPFGICAVSGSSSEIIISFWSREFCRYLSPLENALWSLKANICLVEVRSLFVGTTNTGSNKVNRRFHNDLNFQHVLYRMDLDVSGSVFRQFFAGVIKECNTLLHIYVMTRALRPELTEARYFECVIENFGQRRKFVTVNGKSAFLPLEKCPVKSLETICIDLLRGLVLPEDIHLLPLPQKLKDILKDAVYMNIQPR